VMVEEPDTESAISILRGIKDKYEAHHKVRIKDEAIIAAVEQSQRYISDRFLPDKAIDLIDEASAKLRMEINSKPEELDVLDRKLMQMEIELAAISREGNELKINHLKEDISKVSEQRNEINAKWLKEKQKSEDLTSIKKEIETLKLEAERASRVGDYAKVAEIQYGKIKEKEADLHKLELEMQNNLNELIKEEVTAENISEVISKWTGIPVTKLLQSERQKLLHLEDELHKRVVGQDEAIVSIADAIRRNRAGLNDEKKPIGSFLFLGTTGVGKTELAKALAGYLFDDENNMTRIDMSEYQERHSVSRLVGAPPGYVGYDEGGQLTEAVRRRPYSVVLLDEIEKAHPDVFNTLLQVLDDGRLTDNKGRVVNFKNSIIIMTSNLGSHLIQENFENITDDNISEIVDKTKDEVFGLLKQTLRPEFLNRIDEIVLFQPLNRKEIGKIVNYQLRGFNKMLEKRGIFMTATDDAVSYLMNKGYDPSFGARPLKRVLQQEVLNKLSKEILAGTVNDGDRITLDYFDETGLVFRPTV
ncbi:MAG: AAA family ATPase, partial [Chryseobacterium sp.]|nr:AAA family ATPase [Chryseobacterium sp.]